MFFCIQLPMFTNTDPTHKWKPHICTCVGEREEQETTSNLWHNNLQAGDGWDAKILNICSSEYIDKRRGKKRILLFSLHYHKHPVNWKKTLVQFATYLSYLFQFNNSKAKTISTSETLPTKRSPRFEWLLCSL